jgi:O-antigen ligase
MFDYPSQTGVVLFAALAFVMVARGGYFARGQPIVALLMTGAVGLALAYRRIQLGDFAHPVVVTSGLVAAWSLGRAAGLGTIGLGLGTAALVGLTSATFLLTRSESEAAKRVLLNGVLVVGGVVAMSGWVGVAFRWEPLAIPTAGLWRAATVITYANAAAIVLVMLALVGLGQLAAGRNASRSVLLMLLLLGAAATFSRGGALAFGPTRILAVLVAPAAGATVAFTGLLPALPQSAPPRPLLAVGALAAGMLVTVGLGRRGMPVRVVGALLGCVVLVLVVLSFADPGGRLSERFSPFSSERLSRNAAALELFADQPLIGTGPGPLWLTWEEPDGRMAGAWFVHNEYLQVLVQLGVIGALLVAAMLVVAARTVAQGRSTSQDALLWAGISAALIALLVQSAFDFLWHVPLIPMLAAVLVGGAARPTTKEVW